MMFEGLNLLEFNDKFLTDETQGDGSHEKYRQASFRRPC